jgi:three-Cys-motif partner protein
LAVALNLTKLTHRQGSVGVLMLGKHVSGVITVGCRVFFDQPEEQSEVKTTIVTKYFWAWSKVVIPRAKKRSNRIAYIDLFAGPGCYRDGTKSTPLLLLEEAIQNPDMCEMLVTIFNDANEEYARSLEEAINSLPGIGMLKYKPRVHHFEVGAQIAQILQGRHLVPTLLFVDPWGYKGLTLNLIGSVLKDWGSDCIFFFNYNRINMGLSNDLVRAHMDALFGKTRADMIRAQLDALDSYERELMIVEELARALQEIGGNYVLPFCFKNSEGNRTSHHLIFVSKNIVAYEIMKEIMARECSRVEQGVPTFEYNPADRRFLMLFELSRPLDDLAKMLLSEFAGKTLSMQEVYREHHVGKRYIKRNYKDVLRQLESEGRIKTDPPAERRRQCKGQVTFADHVQVTFSPLAQQ